MPITTLNLLLILSALLSALTGAIGARMPEVRLHHVAATVRTAAQVAPARAATVRPQPRPAALTALAVAPVATAFVLTALVALHALRRRE